MKAPPRRPSPEEVAAQQAGRQTAAARAEARVLETVAALCRLAGVAPSGDAVVRQAGLSPRSTARALKALVGDGRLVAATVRGRRYYRPGRPPIEPLRVEMRDGRPVTICPPAVAAGAYPTAIDRWGPLPRALWDPRGRS